MDSTAAEIARYHISLGWPGCGYQFVCHWDGTIEQAHDIEVMSYNVASRNDKVVGICLPGDYTSREPRKEQLAAALHLAHWLQASALPWAEIVGHGQIALPGNGTSCPGKIANYL